MGRKGRSIWPWLLTGLAIVLLLGFLGVGFLSAIFGGGLFGGGTGRVILDDEEDEEGVFVVIPVEGVIIDAALEGVNPVWWVERCLERAGREDGLKGILLRVNSPGGGIRASDEILRYLREFKEEHDVPIVVWMKDVAASGGYYISTGADWIVAHEDTITGSIGVIWNMMNWQELMRNKLGVEFGNVKSAPKKDIGSPNRAMTTDERALIQRFVDEAYAKFVRLVVVGRAGKGEKPVTEESVRALESTIISGRWALDEGLVDQLGSRDEALAKLRELAGIERADVVGFAKPQSLMNRLLGAEADPMPFGNRIRQLEYLYTEGPPLLSIWER